ncbi:hypothetical protein AGMMS49546_04740 [Spirochaetia bacterium]|nr:hypothetical protein AGMMS49546_04740 [Spirochaetia bacterium]
MIKTTDLYSILRAYANKYNSPYIEIEPFLTFLGKYAAHMVKDQPEWAKWQEDTGLKFWNEMSEYAEDGRCVLLTDTAEGRVYMPFFYVEKLKEIYKSIDENADIPFPSEDSFGITLPKDQLNVLNLEADLAPYFDKPAESFLPIVKLMFPDTSGSALILAPMIPRRLMEAAIVKVRYYLGVHGNKEYAIHKLSPQLSGNEGFIREALDQVITRPLDYLNTIETSGESTWLLWTCFCNLVKNDIKRKNEKLAEDIAVLEAAYIIETCNGLYKLRAQKEREREVAFRALDQRMDQAPYYFSLEAITKFTNNKGVLLLSQYSNEELEACIKKKTTESVNNEAPEWLIILGRNDERWFIKKSKYLPLVNKMLWDVQSQARQDISDRWIKMIREFQHEPAMDSDTEFDKLLMYNMESLMPLLVHFLHDAKLLLVYEEFERTQGMIPPASRIFSNGKLLPASTLFRVKRRDLLMDAKLSLPFWYSVPVLSSIIAFFSKLGKKKKPKQTTRKNMQSDIDFEEVENAAEKNPTKALVNAAREIQAVLVPEGKSLDEYLEELEGRWGRLILKKEERQNMISDMRSLIRDHLRQILRIRKNKKITRQALEDTAAGIIAGHPALKNLGGKDALQLYMELYMVKQLLTIKM